MTPEEASELFDRLDANGDGVLQPEEWHEAASEAGEIARRRKFQAMDKDGNGVLDRQEVMAVAGDFNMTEMEASALFNRIDGEFRNNTPHVAYTCTYRSSTVESPPSGTK